MTTLLILPLYKDQLCAKTMTFVQRPHNNWISKMVKAYLTLLQDNFCIQDHLFAKTTPTKSIVRHTCPCQILVIGSY